MISRNKLRMFKVVVASIVLWAGASSCAYRGRPIPERVVDTLQRGEAVSINRDELDAFKLRILNNK